MSARETEMSVSFPFSSRDDVEEPSPAATQRWTWSPSLWSSFDSALQARQSGRLRSDSAPHSFSFTPPVESTRVFGAYALPIAAPDMVGDREQVPVRSKSFDLGLLRVSDELQQDLSSTGRGRRQSDWENFRIWRRAKIGTGFTIGLVLAYTAVEAAKTILSVKALRGSTISDGQVLVVLQGAVSLICGIIFTAAQEGKVGVKTAFLPSSTLSCLPVSVGFSLSQSALAWAICRGIGAAAILVTGYLYMPLCALLSALVFRRRYGWLEVHGLVFLTLSIMIFVELGARETGLSHSYQAIHYNFISIVFSCSASVYLEKLLKPKYSERSSLDQHFYIQKVWLETGGLLLSIPTLFVLRAFSTGTSLFSGSWLQMIHVAFSGWMCAAILARVVQSWFTGYVSKYLSTLGRAVIQCVAVILVHFWDTFFFGEHWSLVTTLLAIVVCLSAMMYQTGRRITSVLPGRPHGRSQSTGDALADGDRGLQASASSQTGADASQSMGASTRRSDGSILIPNAQLISCEFEPNGQTDQTDQPAEQAQPRIGLLDRTWYEQAKHINTNLALWLSSSAGRSTQVLCVVSFVLADASRNLINAWAIKDTPIVQQSVVWALSASSIPIGIVMSGLLDGREGARDSLLWRDALTCLPVAACFSFGQTLQIKAYGAGISASVNTVLGYFYMPMSALLSRWVFQRAYSRLEWLALALLSLTAVVFCLLRSSRSTEDATSTLAIACCVGSVVSSCIGSLMCEKIMKARPYPFYTQKVHLEFGGLATATAMLFVVGSLSSRPEDAFWKQRPANGQMEAGLFVGWSYKTAAALTAAAFQSWLGGLVSKRLSTVVRSVAQCCSLLIIYFLGDLVLRGLPFDWIVGAAAVVVALSVQVFTLAGRKRIREGGN
ncbi:Hypothetical protein SCF082_LOCUS9633 [Durusdinium trenchii]|uniref:Uncharacterized protein n=1 Tax=Durusdinium trenchii TaxID=1381693 RepID=A0ABP0J0J5_9DINO